MKVADWEDYKVIATGDGEKLEKWGNVVLLRPDPQVIAVLLHIVRGCVQMQLSCKDAEHQR